MSRLVTHGCELRPNQSLKLTEPAVDDSMRAKQPATIGQDLSRADWIRCCGTSLPQLSSGTLASNSKGSIYAHAK